MWWYVLFLIAGEVFLKGFETFPNRPTYHLQRISCILILIKPSIEIEGFILQASSFTKKQIRKQNIRLE